MERKKVTIQERWDSDSDAMSEYYSKQADKGKRRSMEEIEESFRKMGVIVEVSKSDTEDKE